MLKLSCGNASFPLLTNEASIELVAQLGFDGYDLMLASGRPMLHLEEAVADPARWAETYRARILGRGLEIAELFCVPSNDQIALAPNHPDPEECERGREQFRAVLDLATRLGAPGLTMMPGVNWPHESHESSLTRAAEELGRRVVQARDRGLRFSVEAGIGSICETPADTQLLCDLAPGLELTLDYSHFTARGFSDASIEPLLAHTRHFHVRGARDGRIQAPMKESSIDFDRVVDVLLENGYGGYLATEYSWLEWGGMNELDVLSETILMRDRLRAKLAGEVWSYPVVPGITTAME